MNLQEVTVENMSVTVILGDIATLKWSLKKGITDEIGAVKIYRGNRLNESAFLIDSRKFEGNLEHFNQRLFVGFIGDPNKKSAVDFELNITNAKYGDKGMFYLRAPFTKGGNTVYGNATLILNVKGSLLIFS